MRYPIHLLVLFVVASCRYLPFEPVPPIVADSTEWGDPLRVVWRYEKPVQSPLGLVESPPIQVDGDLIYPYDTTFLRISATTGEVKWQTNTLGVYQPGKPPAHIASELMVSNQICFFVTTDFVTAVRINDGEKLWQYDVDGDIAGMHGNSSSDDAIFVSLRRTNTVAAVSKLTGKELWRADLMRDLRSKYEQRWCWPGPATYHNGVVYVGMRLYPGDRVITDYQGAIVAIDASTGEIKWTSEMPSPNGTEQYDGWKMLRSSTCQWGRIHADDSELVFASGFAIAHMDYSGKFLARRVPNLNGNVSQLETPLMKYRGSYYGTNSGNYYSFVFKYDAPRRKIEYANSLGNSRQAMTVGNFPPYIDSIGGTLTQISDDDWLVQTDLETGRNIWRSRIGYADLAPNRDGSPCSYRGICGGLLVKGDRFYFMNADAIVCVEKVRR